jgi:membrane dipeptidase
MLIIDGHLDLSWNALQWDRDLTQSVYTLRVLEGGTPGKARAANTVALPELKRGRIGVCFATLLARSTGRPVPGLDYGSAAQAYGAARGQLAYYRALEQAGEVVILTEWPALESHVTGWQAWLDKPKDPPPPVGLVISMESADPVLTPGQLAQWWEDGLRLIGPAHYGPGRYAGGTGVEDGLTETGTELLAEMARLGFVLDLTHFSDRAFWQALEGFDGPVIASHNNCRALVPHQRQFDNAQLRAIIARQGVIGAALDTWMLLPGWVRGQSSNENVTLADVVDHIDHICQLAGNSSHVAIGSDLDGGFGREQSPRDLDTIADLQKLIGLLGGRGYSDDDIAAVLHGNWLALLRRAWGAAPA